MLNNTLKSAALVALSLASTLSFAASQSLSVSAYGIADFSMQSMSITVPAGETATITIRTWCTQLNSSSTPSDVCLSNGNAYGGGGNASGHALGVYGSNIPSNTVTETFVSNGSAISLYAESSVYAAYNNSGYTNGPYSGSTTITVSW